MHTHQHRHTLGTAAATFALVITAGCGTEVATTPARISDPVEQERTQPASPNYMGEPLSDVPQRGRGAEGWR